MFYKISKSEKQEYWDIVNKYERLINKNTPYTQYTHNKAAPTKKYLSNN